MELRPAIDGAATSDTKCYDQGYFFAGTRKRAEAANGVEKLQTIPKNATTSVQGSYHRLLIKLQTETKVVGGHRTN